VNRDPYADKADKYFSSSRSEMLRYVPADVRDVLEVGCGGAAFAAEIKRTRHARVTGIEPFETAAETAATRIDEVLQTGAEEGLGRLRGRFFDCIVFNDVLEHLVDPESILAAAASLLRPQGTVVASIPNMRYLPVLRDLVLRGEWRYTNDGILDRTHLRFFTHKSIAELFAACGYRVHKLEGINPRPVSWKFRLVNLMLARSIDDMRYLQFAVVASRIPG
jgi:2-polyprenyl-3-methyl-5-hydroxy-6-metoxy-1,4-benzoquinol methylase